MTTQQKNPYEELAASLIYVLDRNGLLISDKAKAWAKERLPNGSVPPFRVMNEASQKLWGEDLVPLETPKGDVETSNG